MIPHVVVRAEQDGYHWLIISDGVRIKQEEGTTAEIAARRGLEFARLWGRARGFFRGEEVEGEA